MSVRVEDLSFEIMAERFARDNRSTEAATSAIDFQVPIPGHSLFAAKASRGSTAIFVPKPEARIRSAQ
jgi:hypothetical protein